QLMTTRSVCDVRLLFSSLCCLRVVHIINPVSFRPLRVLYLADIRFPLERANGIQSMATCHALASRGHEVTMIVRPDTHTPALDPFVFYGLPKIDRLRIEVVPLTGPPAATRVGYLTYAIGRSFGRARQDLIFTRDLGLAALV